MGVRSINDLNPSEDVIALNRDKLAGMETVTPSKYHNARADAAGMTFASGHEAAGVAGLILAEQQKKIFGLRLQVRFPLQGKNIYVADAVYLDEKLRAHIIDFKGAITKEYRIKKKLFREKYGQAIEEM